MQYLVPGEPTRGSRNAVEDLKPVLELRLIMEW